MGELPSAIYWAEDGAWPRGKCEQREELEAMWRHPFQLLKSADENPEKSVFAKVTG